MTLHFHLFQLGREVCETIYLSVSGWVLNPGVVASDGSFVPKILNVVWILFYPVRIGLVEVGPEVTHSCNLQDGLRVFNLEPIREKAHYTEDQVDQKSILEYPNRRSSLRII